jgi:lipoprotein-anchoring transpeptidase ErfK/SrfK
MKKKLSFLLFLSSLLLANSCFADEYLLKISIARCRMEVYRINADNSLEPVREYVVSTVKPGLAYPFGRGTITRIELNPPWLPVAETRSYFARKKGIFLPAYVPPGHRLNYMGSFKMHLSHRTVKGNIYRIHGNIEPGMLGKRITGGCTRMDNNEGYELAKILKVGTIVEIVRY